MPWIQILWDEDPGGNAEHIAQNGISGSEVQHVLENPTSYGQSRSSGRPIAFGYTQAGRHIGIVYEQIDGAIVRPITAFDVEV